MLLTTLQKRFRERTFFGADECAHGDVVAREPAIARFQNKLDIVSRGQDGVGIVFFEVMDFGNRAARCDVSARNGFRAIFHPKRSTHRIRQNKEHRIGVLNIGAEHHARLFLPFGQGQFGVERLRAEINFHRR